MTARTIADFLAASSQRDASAEAFELENPHLLEVRVSGTAWAKAGSMVAYTGGVRFRREGVLAQGMGNLLKKAVSGEGTQLMKMEGQGRVWLADGGKRVNLLRLQDEEIFVNGNDVLAFEDGIESRITLMRRVAGMMAGGLFNIRLSGRGLVAFGSHYEPLALKVSPRRPVYTDPNATVAWSAGLEPDIVADITLGTLIGRTSGEALQMKFSGSGWVVVQPFEETPRTR